MEVKANYPANLIASYFISNSFMSARPITPMQLLKLVYLAHGWFLGNRDMALIRENIYAWKYGPVIKEVYHKYKEYGGSQITPDYFECQSIPQDTKEFLDKVWDNYCDFSGIQLSTLTHESGSPWAQVYDPKKNGQDQIIPNNIIKHYYEQLVSQAS